MKAYQLREMSQVDLLKTLEDNKKTLSELLVQKMTGGSQNKVASIKSVRKSIARTLTVYHAKVIADARKAHEGKKFVPKALRVKKTRAIRQRLAKKDVKSVARVATRKANFPKRKYAVAASK